MEMYFSANINLTHFYSQLNPPLKVRHMLQTPSPSCPVSRLGIYFFLCFLNEIMLYTIPPMLSKPSLLKLVLKKAATENSLLLPPQQLQEGFV